MILASAALCLALNIYHEARGEMIPGQYAVANVTINRAGGNNERICDVVAEPKQFSWTQKLLTVKNGQYLLKKKGYPTDEAAWELAYRIANYAMKHPATDFTGGRATHYHAITVDPSWRFKLEKTKRVGKHIFYRMAAKSSMTEKA